MSGRVRWGERHEPNVLALVGVRGDFYVIPWRGWWLADADGYMRQPNPTFKRRSDAKRWLLARAAGLAEVPRARRPRGWRYLGSCGVCDPWSGEVDTIEMHERNRRRR